MKIVVTGALGHIGSQLIRTLPYTFPGVEIVMIDNLSSQRYCSLFNLPAEGNYRFIETDVVEAELRPLVGGADVVIHLAAITDAAGSFKNRDLVEQVNYRAVVNVSETCADVGVPMIHMSTTSVYGTQKQVVDEDCSPEELQPQSPYAETKIREEQFLQDLGSKSNLRFIICRNGTICGISPGMRFHTAINKFCWQAVMGQPLTVWRTALHQKRPYLVLSDALAALEFIIRNDLFDQRIYNVLTENLTVNDIAQHIREQIPHLEIEYVDTEIMNQLSYEVSNRRFMGQGFEFDGSVVKNIAETIDLLKTAGNRGT